MKLVFCLLAIGAMLFIGCGEDDTEAPTVESTNPSDGATSVAVTTDIVITFSESMDAATVQANYNDTQPTGSVQVSADNFTTVVRMESGTASNENKTYTFTPMMDLDTNTIYEIMVTVGCEDAAGNPLEAAYNSDFTTE